MEIEIPVEEAVTIYNALTRMAPDNETEASRAEWRLRTLNRAQPGDHLIGLALVYAFLMTGKAQEAINLTDRLWLGRNAMGLEQLGTFLFELYQMGQYERAAELLAEIHRANLRMQVTSLDDIAVELAWALGDLEGLSAAAPAMLSLAAQENWSQFIADLRDTGLGRHFSERQNLIRLKTSGKQCFNQLLLMPGDDERWSVNHYVYVNASYEERLALEDDIHHSLDSFFSQFDLEAVHWTKISELIVPLGAAPAWHKDSISAAA
jgi:hypothetical protein